MIDMHTHILPNIDDGSKNIEESIEMLKEAQEAGFTGLVSTSHFIEESYITSKKEREELINNLNNKLILENINIKIYNGAEAYISNNLNELINNSILSTINGSRYLLMELPMNSEIIYLDEIICNLKHNGIVPIIAHPERYSYVQKNPNMLAKLIEQGVLFQGNYGSIIGKYGKQAEKTIKKLLKSNMIHFLGTDAHRSKSVYTQMNIILKNIEKLIGKEKLEKISTINPIKVINNKEIEIDEPSKIKKLFM